MVGFACNAIQSAFDAWAYVDFCDEERVFKNLVAIYRWVRSAEGADRSDSIFSAPEFLYVQNSMPCEPPKTYAGKVRSLLRYCVMFLFAATKDIDELSFRRLFENIKFLSLY